MTGSSIVASIASMPIWQILLIVVVGSLATHVLLKRMPNLRLAAQMVFLIALTALLLNAGIVPYAKSPAGTDWFEKSLIAVTKVIWWITLAGALIGAVRVFLVWEEQPRNGRLIQDLIVGIVYVGAALSIVAYVFDAPVGTLIATSGIFAIILGLALQSTLGDVFSGIALNLGRPYSIGDWIVLGDGTEGRVVQTDWRATYLLNGANDLVIVPNSDIAKARLTNSSSPERTHGVVLRTRFAPTTTPDAMAAAMRNALASSNTILHAPEPGVQVRALDAIAVELELSFSVADIGKVGAARNEVFDLIYRHAKAAGLRLAPQATAVVAEGTAASGNAAVAAPRSTPLRLLDALPLFASLSEEEKNTLAATMTRRAYRAGDTVVEQGSVLTSLMVVRTGVLAASRAEDGREIELDRLAPGDCFGESGLLVGASEIGTLRALAFTVVYEIPQDGLSELMHERPALAEELAQILGRRATAERLRIDANAAALHRESAPGVAARIRRFFHLPDG